MHAPVQAVTFDFWNTLAWEEPGHLRQRRLRAWAGILEEAGFAPDADGLAAAFDASWASYETNWIAGRQYLHHHAASDIVSTIGLDIDDATRRRLVEAFETAGHGADIRPADGIAACLETLAGAGVRLGIVCDVGMTPSVVLRKHLAAWGLLGLFDGWSFSDEVGHYKPARQIFEHALDGLGNPDPARTAHVGDRLRTDVAGALGMGMIAVRYTGLYEDRDEGFEEAHHVVGAHADLPAALSIADPVTRPGSPTPTAP